MRETENHHQNTTVIIAVGKDPAMDAKISGQNFEKMSYDSFYDDVPRAVIFIDRGWKGSCPIMESQCLLGTAFQWRKIRKFW